MINASTLVQTSMKEVAPEGFGLPTPISTAFNVIHSVHRTFRWIRRIHLYAQNCFKVALGGITNFVAGDDLILRISAVFLMVATRILECVKEQVKLQHAWKKFVDAIQGNFSKPTIVEWNSEPTGHLFSESTIQWFKIQMQTLWCRIQRIFIKLYQMAHHLILLSIKIADAVDDIINVFKSSSMAASEGITEFFVNSSKWTNKLVENKDLLVDGLKANKAVIEKVLKGVSGFFTADQLIQNAEKSLNRVTEGLKAVDKVCKTGDEFLSECFKKWGHEFLQFLGVDHMIPNEALPSPKPFWENETRVIDRFPEKSRVTRQQLPTTPLSSPQKVVYEEKSTSDATPKSPAKSPNKKRYRLNPGFQLPSPSGVKSPPFAPPAVPVEIL